MDRNKFVLNVFSSDSMEIHPENKLSSWTTELDSVLELGKCFFIVYHSCFYFLEFQEREQNGRLE